VSAFCEKCSALAAVDRGDIQTGDIDLVHFDFWLRELHPHACIAVVAGKYVVVVPRAVDAKGRHIDGGLSLTEPYEHPMEAVDAALGAWSPGEVAKLLDELTNDRNRGDDERR